MVDGPRGLALPLRRARAAAVDLPAFAATLYGAVVVAWVASSSGGYFQTTWSWTALATLLAATLALVLRARVAVGRLDVLLVTALFGFTCWTAASALWSPSVPSTLDETTRCLAYLGVVAAALLLTERRTAGNLLTGVFVGIVLVCLYALGTRVLPDRLGTFDSFSGGYRLSAPIT